jgi:hypothetical protein
MTYRNRANDIEIRTFEQFIATPNDLASDGTIVITHNLNASHVIVTLWNYYTEVTIIPDEVQSLGNNQVKLTLTTLLDTQGLYRAVINK